MGSAVAVVVAVGLGVALGSGVGEGLGAGASRAPLQEHNPIKSATIRAAASDFLLVIVPSIPVLRAHGGGRTSGALVAALPIIRAECQGCGGAEAGSKTIAHAGNPNREDARIAQRRAGLNGTTGKRAGNVMTGTHQPVAVVTGGGTANSLGVVRSLGRHGVPVVYLDSEPRSMVRHSRYIRQRLPCPSPSESEAQFVAALLAFGSQVDRKMVIIPTSDSAVLSLAKHRSELERFYHLPVPSFETVNRLVNKKLFYQMLAEMGIPHPRTCFPRSLTELASMAREMDCPYMIKPALSHRFQAEFRKKCFVVNSARDLDGAVRGLENRNLEVMLQEIVPGKRVFTYLAYLDRSSEPLAVCGWEKVRNSPPDFGNGTFCVSAWDSTAVELGLGFLRSIGYRGFAGPEFKIDPRDGAHKMLEVNPRTTLANALAGVCGTDVTYAAYLDSAGCQVPQASAPRSGVRWVDDYVDWVSFVVHLKQRRLGTREIWETLKPGKVHSLLAWDDPAPFLARGAGAGLKALRQRLSGRS